MRPGWMRARRGEPGAAQPPSHRPPKMCHRPLAAKAAPAGNGRKSVCRVSSRRERLLDKLRAIVQLRQHRLPAKAGQLVLSMPDGAHQLGAVSCVYSKLRGGRSGVEDKHPAVFIGQKSALRCQNECTPCPLPPHLSKGDARQPPVPNWDLPSGSHPLSQKFRCRLTKPCYTLFNRRIRSEVLACSGYRLLANFHIAFAVNQYRRSNTQWKQAQSSGLMTPRVLDF